MNTEALFLFLILLLGLVLCSFLGGRCGNEGFTGKFTGTFTGDENNQTGNNGASKRNHNSKGGKNGSASSNSYDNYNHYSGTSSQLVPGTTFNGPNGGTVVVNPTSNGSQSLQITLAGGNQPLIFTAKNESDNSSTTTESYTNYSGDNGTATTYYGPSGEVATVINTNNGGQVITVQTSSGSYTYTQSGNNSNQDDLTSTQYYGSTGYQVQPDSGLSYQGPYGGSAGSATGQGGNTAYYAQGPYGNTAVGTSTNNNYDQGPYGGSAGSATGPGGNTAYYAQGPYGNTAVGTSSSNNYDYSSSLPSGIPASQIPAGQEDLYILKSQIVPPVCPACPTSAACPRQEKCSPCPACARCPEPSFECKKVPNYNAIDNSYLPAPVLSDFSSFGM